MNEKEREFSREPCRLAAILFADIVGYSRMPQRMALEARKRMLGFAQEILAAPSGRLVKTQGDDILVEFASASDAAAFAVGLQGRVAARNAAVAKAERFRLRVGIHAGEVIPEGEDVLGDTVNVAKRTESLAGPGGVCLTEPVWHEVSELLPRPAWRLGRVAVKHIKRPIAFYHLDPPGAGWPYRVGHRVRLGVGHPVKALGLLALGVLALWSTVLLAPLGESLLPANPPKLIARARACLDRYDKEGCVQRAIDLLARVPNTAPEFDEAQAYLALAQWRRFGETRELKARTAAWNAAANAITANAENPLPHYVQGLVEKDRGYWGAASNQLSRANVLAAGQDGLVLIELAAVCKDLRDPAGAAGYVQQALEVESKPWFFYHELAKYEQARGHFAAALTNGLQAVALSPKNSLAELNVASFFLSQDDYTNHLKDVAIYLERSRKHRTTPLYYYTLGQYLSLQDRPEAAIPSFEKAAALNPKDYRLRGRAGVALKDIGLTNDAARFLKQAVGQANQALADSKDGLILAYIGFYEACLGHPQAAISAMEEALRELPENDQVRQLARRAAAELGEAEEARKLLRLLDKPPKPQ